MSSAALGRLGYLYAVGLREAVKVSFRDAAKYFALGYGGCAFPVLYLG
jgi:hypothetical protein